MRTEMRARDGGGGGGGVEDPPANTTKWGYFEMGAPKWTRRGVSKWHGCQIASYRTSGISAFSVYSYGTTFFCAVGIGIGLFSLVSVNSLFSVLSVNSLSSLLSLNSAYSVLSINSAFSVFSSSSLFAINCRGENGGASYKICA